MSVRYGPILYKYLSNVVSKASIQHCIGYFPHKHCLSTIWANIALVMYLCNVGSDRSTQNCRLFSCVVVCGPWVNNAQVTSRAMLAQADQDNIVVKLSSYEKMTVRY